VIKAAASVLPQQHSCVSFLEAFVVEAAHACASQTLSPAKAKLTSLCSGDAFQSSPRSTHCSLMIAALELVSLCGSKNRCPPRSRPQPRPLALAPFVLCSCRLRHQRHPQVNKRCAHVV
jgi:hypothetical protein